MALRGRILQDAPARTGRRRPPAADPRPPAGTVASTEFRAAGKATASARCSSTTSCSRAAAGTALSGCERGGRGRALPAEAASADDARPRRLEPHDRNAGDGEGRRTVGLRPEALLGRLFRKGTMALFEPRLGRLPPPQDWQVRGMLLQLGRKEARSFLAEHGKS